MLPYWFLFGLAAWLALTRLRPATVSSPHWPDWWRLMFILLVLTIGMRYEVGGDWGNYSNHIEDAGRAQFLDAIRKGDPAYSLLNWLAARTKLGVYLVNTICAMLFSWGLVVFCRAQPRPWLALAVAVPYLVVVVAMGYTRQGTAIGLAMVGLVALSDRKLRRFVVFVALAATFHKSAVILMPLALLSGAKRRLWTVLWVSSSFFVFYALLLQDSVETLNSNYLEAEYQSEGAAVRVAMNAIPAVLFLCLRHRFTLSEAERVFWTWMCIGAVAIVGLWVASPSSTAVDRVALYWIPVQLFVLSRLPNALGKRNGLNTMLVLAVVAYTGTVLFVWLFFATHAHYWLPYNFYPWVLLWS